MGAGVENPSGYARSHGFPNREKYTMAQETEIPKIEDEEDDFDACDCSAAVENPTPDEDLPAAAGGVA